MIFNPVILGSAGYGGGELLRLLFDHPNAGPVQAVSHSHAGKPIYSAHPALRGFIDHPFLEEADWTALAQSEHPVVFSAQPHGELAKQLPALEAAWEAAGIAERLVLVDLSGDFRLDDRDVFQKAYSSVHPCPEYLGKFVYGCPEVARQKIVGSKRIANPGCFATALNLALLPLAGLGVRFVAVSAATGSSGSGAKAQAGTHHPERSGDFRAYKVLTHQHQAEVSGLLAANGLPDLHLAFVPHSAPIVRGIFATVQFELPKGLDKAKLKDRYKDFYKDAPFIRMLDDSPRVAAVTGTNMTDIAVHADGHSAVVLAALDNLGKGMAGQAIQNLNLALGLEETCGLWRPARWPS
jgi:N-acetyl-gamma-glutamyl-phosphate/LysW-gamma-L-alpha-aminoadipyl-6-phosphate reductase